MLLIIDLKYILVTALYIVLEFMALLGSRLRSNLKQKPNMITFQIIKLAYS